MQLTMAFVGVGVFLAAVAGLAAQEVRLDGGEVIAGTVVDVTGNRARIRCVDGTMKQVHVRRVDHESAADGAVRRFHASSCDGALDDRERALLLQVHKGTDVPVPELVLATDRCSSALIEALQGELANGEAAARLPAARALAATAVPAAVRAALTAAVEEPTGHLLEPTARMLMSGAGLAALEAADARPLVDRGLTTKDAGARFAMAWIGAKIGSDAALPVLGSFLTDRDHHIRESAAVALAERGDAAGATILLTMAKRDRAPVQTANRSADAATRALVDRLALRERCSACELLGRLRHAPALPVLRRLAAAKNPELAAAATRAVAAYADGG